MVRADLLDHQTAKTMSDEYYRPLLLLSPALRVALVAWIVLTSVAFRQFFRDSRKAFAKSVIVAFESDLAINVL